MNIPDKKFLIGVAFGLLVNTITVIFFYLLLMVALPEGKYVYVSTALASVFYMSSAICYGQLYKYDHWKKPKV